MGAQLRPPARQCPHGQAGVVSIGSGAKKKRYALLLLGLIEKIGVSCGVEDGVE
ncbi:hypothetical protein P3W85_29240 [Cupriavidus basilensis]|uniref:Uncharacterized protein n=1 Tax=Cupriavidus basilensis TaxID=68895 RepID=A0ABT6AWK3_9BURK|nr:hypothetical protein [Cupriavidus basilensis]MDF3837008.1 hypothetical protein [Cupriavidus basilensis]